jgi:hypothetical protein
MTAIFNKSSFPILAQLEFLVYVGIPFLVFLSLVRRSDDGKSQAVEV